MTASSFYREIIQTAKLTTLHKQSDYMAHGMGAYTIVACSSHPVEEDGIDLDWCKEVEEL